MKKFLFIAAILFVQVISLSAQSDSTKYGVMIPKGFTYQLDVVYEVVDGWEGKVDLYLPPNNGKPTPVLINIYGGGWNHGNKESQRGFSAFFKSNMAVANISYRLVDVAPAPAAIQDVRSLMIYLIKHAKELNIDPDKIVLMGGSAGGHLAMMGGYLANNSIYDIDRQGVKNIKAAAVLDKYGISDMVDFSVGSKPYKSAVRWVGNKINDKGFIQSISPIYYVNKNTPPTFVVHGDADPIVPYEQSVRLVEKLKANGVKSEFMTVPGGLHGKFTKEQNKEMSDAMIAFLKEVKVIE